MKDQVKELIETGILNKFEGKEEAINCSEPLEPSLGYPISTEYTKKQLLELKLQKQIRQVIKNMSNLHDLIDLESNGYNEEICFKSKSIYIFVSLMEWINVELGEALSQEVKAKAIEFCNSLTDHK